MAAAGYDTIDIWGGRPHVYRHDYSHQALIELRKQIDGEGLKVSSFLPAFYRYPHNLCSPNEVNTPGYARLRTSVRRQRPGVGCWISLDLPGSSAQRQSHADDWQRLRKWSEKA